MVLDLIVILIIALFTFLGYKQGLVKTAIKILAFFIALIVSMTIYKTIGNIVIKNTQIDEKIESKIMAKILPENYDEKLKILPNSLIESGNQSVNNLVVVASERAIYFVVFIILFIIIRITLKFVTVFADFVTKLPIIKQFDKAGGLIYGLAKGFIIVTSVFAVVSLISPMLDSKYINTIDNSYLSKTLYNHNLIIGLIK